MTLKRKIKNVISRTLIKCIDFNELTKPVLKRYKELALKKCTENVIIGNNSGFYEDAKVYNSRLKEHISIGDNTRICGQLLVFKYGGEIKIGNYCYVGEGTRIWSGESVTIGNNVLISHNVNIVDTNAHEISFEERASRYKSLIKDGPWDNKGSIITSPVIIEDDVWISFGVIILKGITIGKGAIIAAGSVVTKDVEKLTMVAGNPAKFVKKVD